MQLQGSFEVNAPRPAAFKFLLDPHRLGKFLPDVQGIEVHDENSFTMKAKVGVSHIKGTMAMKITVVDRHEPVSAKLVGKGAGMASVVDMTTEFTLDEVSASRTRVNWKGEAAIGGKLAAFGGGLMDRLAQKNLEGFVAGIQTGMEHLEA